MLHKLEMPIAGKLMHSLSSPTIFAAVTVSLILYSCANPVDAKHRNNSDDFSSAKNSWKLAVPINSVSPNGLPAGRLFLLLRKDKVDQVRTLLKETAKKKGDDAERAMWLGACLSSEERYEQAVQMFDQFKTWEEAPNLVIILAAKAYSEDQKFDKAIKLCSIVLAKWPMPEAYRVRAAAYILTNKNDLAVADYIALADSDAYAAKHHLMRAGNLLVKMGQYDKALALMDRATLARGGSQNVTIWLVRGDCYKAQKKWQKAVDAFTSSIELSKVRQVKASQFSLPVAFKERAYCYEKLGKHALAATDRRSLSQLSKSMESDLIGEPKD